jgi:hypothetical protein
MQAVAVAAQAQEGQSHRLPLAAQAAVVQVDTTLEPLPELLGCQTLAAAQVAAGKIQAQQAYRADLAS